MKTPSKVAVGIMTLVISAAAISGNVLLEQKFDPTWFLPPETYLAQWFDVNRKYFPFGGDRWPNAFKFFDDPSQMRINHC